MNKNIIVSKDEIFSITQYLNLIKLKFEKDDWWRVLPIFYAFEDGIELIGVPESNVEYTSVSENVLIKFQKQGYEYLIDAKVKNISLKRPITISLNFISGQKYYNMREYPRFDINIKGTIYAGNSVKETIIKNISLGGVMIISDLNSSMGDVLDLKLYLDNIELNLQAKVVRKVNLSPNTFSYGVQFLEQSEEANKDLIRIISLVEKKYLDPLNTLKKYGDKKNLYFDTKILILSSDIDNSFDIRESLTKLGVENFHVITGLNFYTEYLQEEQPKIVIFDITTLDEDNISVIRSVYEDFNTGCVVVILPIEYAEDEEEIRSNFEHIEIMYKPLIYNEFEENIIRYL